MGWWSDAWNWVKKTAKKVWKAVKNEWDKWLGKFVKTTLAVLSLVPGIGLIAAIVLGVIIWVEGVAYIVKYVNKKTGEVQLEKKRLLGVGLALIAAPNCSQETFDDAQHILSETRGLLTFMVASNFTNGKHLCDNMLPAYEYAERYIESCYVDDGNILKDTGKMLKDSYNLISRFCQDEQYRKQLSDNSRCQIQPRNHCIQKYKSLLVNKGLLSSNDTGQTRANTESSPDIKTTCSAIGKVNSCAKKEKKSLMNCPPDQYQALEDSLSTDFDSFCDKHRNWDPVAKGRADNKKEPAKNTTTGAASMSRMSMLSYVAIVAIRAA